MTRLAAIDRAPPRWPTAALASVPLMLDQASSQREITPDGHLRIHRTVLTESTVNDYLGSEIPGWQSLGLEPDKRYPLLRDPDELRRAVKTFEALPVTYGHRPVSSDDHPFDLTVGATGSDAEFNFP